MRSDFQQKEFDDVYQINMLHMYINFTDSWYSGGGGGGVGM